jgi:DNA polymerase-1
MRSLVYDISNLLFRVAAVQKHKAGPFMTELSTEDLVGMSMHVALQSINKWYSKYNPDFIVFAFEGGDNWRKKYTQENTNIRRQYKANRVVDPEMFHLHQLLDSFYDIMSNHTSICCLKVDQMEGDDVIGAYTQLFASDDHEVIIVSGDRDFVQLLKLPNVKLIDPDSGKPRNQPGDKEYFEDLDYWMFLKCVRGDGGDNVPSAYPRVWETKVKAAFNDTFTMLNFLNTTWTDENDITHRVGDLIEHNRVLMDLSKQPDEIRTKLVSEVERQVADLKTYSHFHFLKFLGKHNLQRVGEDASRYVTIFTNNQQFLKGVRKQHAEVLQEAQKGKPAPVTTKSALLDF